MKQLTSNVYAEDRHSLSEGYRGCNPGFVTTAEGVVLIDTPMLPADAVRWANLIGEHGAVRYLVNTHCHIDHVAGNFFLPGTVVAQDASAAQFEVPIRELSSTARADDAVTAETSVADFVRTIADELDPASGPLLEGYELRGPAVSFSERLTLRLGEHTFELIHIPGHTPGDLGVYVPEEDVFFAGDAVTSAVFPNLSSSRPLDWVASLERIEAIDPAVVVTGHGPVGDVETVRSFRRFLEGCIADVREAIESGVDAEEAVETIDFEARRPALHGSDTRHRMNVRHLYAELSRP